MARTKLLTNIIQRKMMLLDEMSHSNQHQNFEISLYDFAQHEILEKLYKADNQRSTECWSPDEIEEFILDCLNDRNVNLCIRYWKDAAGNIYIIDGGHRISIIYAWIKRFFIDEQVVGAPKFTAPQKRDIRQIRNRLGGLADFQKLSSDSEFQQKLKSTKINFIQVIGTPEEARKAFCSINSDTKRLDPDEEYHLQNRGSDAFYVIYACCYINDNKSNLAELNYERINEVIALGEQIHDHLFKIILLEPDLAHGKKIGLVNELLNIVFGDTCQNTVSIDQGQRVENLILKLRVVLCRIAKPEISIRIPSLGLHPKLYFYKDNRFQVTSFLAWFSIVFEIEEGCFEIQNKKLDFIGFTRARRSVESLIEKIPVAIKETVGKFGSGIRSHERLKNVYQAFICIGLNMDLDFEDEVCLNTVILSMSQSFDYINFNDFYLERFGGAYDESIVDDVVSFVKSVRPSKKKKPLNFSPATKRNVYQREEKKTWSYCEVCDSALYLESTEVDHRESKAEGGYGILENGAIIHPICNRFKSDRDLDEVRADLFE
ncbi:HNH endonuclease [Acinetobacter sp. BSP-53]|uniref:HNH endonuclease n=1 Tax=Acinetobacter sp. BSP-53 TaxID=3344662 RepID=UPI00376FEAAE